MPEPPKAVAIRALPAWLVTYADADGNFVVVWRADDTANSAIGILGQRFNKIGDTIGTLFEVDTRKPALMAKPEAAMNANGDIMII